MIYFSINKTNYSGVLKDSGDKKKRTVGLFGRISRIESWEMMR